MLLFPLHVVLYAWRRCASSVSHRHLMPLSSSLQASFGSICSPLCSTVTSTGGVKVWVRLKLDFGPTAQHCNQ